jgi:hypothetical protein
MELRKSALASSIGVICSVWMVLRRGVRTRLDAVEVLVCRIQSFAKPGSTDIDNVLPSTSLLLHSTVHCDQRMAEVVLLPFRVFNTVGIEAAPMTKKLSWR